MQTIVTSVCGVCQSVCPSVSLSIKWFKLAAACEACHVSFDAAFAKCLWPLVITSCTLQI